MAIPFKTDNGFGARARLGLVVLQSDETLEPEFARLPVTLPGVSLHHTRIASGENVTRESLLEMHNRLPGAVNLFPVGTHFDAIGYGCTSGATVIGEHAVEQAIRSSRPGVIVTNPLTALKAACQVMNVQSLGLITPYERRVTDMMANKLRDFGVRIESVTSFEQTSEATVARITSDSLLQAIGHIASTSATCDAWFVSCTNLRMAQITSVAEQLVGKPVFSSNQVLAWHLLRLAKINDTLDNWGQLFEFPLS
ncbi:MAG: Asp/Glu racemase, partial [Burkholderiaceae bacterium]